MTIPTLEQITVRPVEIDEEFFELHRLCASGTATPRQLDRLEAMCAVREAEQDNGGIR